LGSPQVSAVTLSAVPQLTTICYFELSNGPENCYNISVSTGQYLIRMYLSYGEQDNSGRSFSVEDLSGGLEKVALGERGGFGGLARYTQNFSGADITEICQHASKYAIREDIEEEVRLTPPITTDPPHCSCGSSHTLHPLPHPHQHQVQ
jgi:hypothetical protein